MAIDAVELLVAPRTRPVGSGEVQRLLPVRNRRMVGPFVFADVGGPDEMGPGHGMDVDAHPHIGLATITHLFSGRLVHRDSLGSVAEIVPGGVNWMTAGAGIAHTERSHPDDRPQSIEMAMLQTWVALPAGSGPGGEDGPPAFESAGPEATPTDRLGPVTVRLLVGTGFGLASPVAGASPLVLAELDLGDGAAIRLPIDHPERAVIAVDSEATLDGTALPHHHLAVLTEGSTPTLTGRGRVMLLGGEPLGKRRIWWNFVHSDPARIEDARHDWAAQRWPQVPGDHDPWVREP